MITNIQHVYMHSSNQFLIGSATFSKELRLDDEDYYTEKCCLIFESSLPKIQLKVKPTQHAL